jgi:hypothetical protein
MTEQQPEPAGQPPGPILRGRYALVDRPGGKMSLPWSVQLCDTCMNCHCGEQMDEFQIPAMMAQLIRAKLEGAGVTPRQKVKAAKSVLGRKLWIRLNWPTWTLSAPRSASRCTGARSCSPRCCSSW